MRSLFFCVLTLLTFDSIGAQKLPIKLGPDDVVVFLGGTDMVRAQESGHLETLLTWKFAIAKPRFRDLSWEADTVFALGTETERWRRDGYRGIKGLGNLEQQLEKIGATDNAHYIERATMKNQKIVPLSDLNGDSAPYFSMIIVRRSGEILEL